MREAGRSAAETGDFERARNFFEQAWESARLCGDAMKPMTAGLSADCAILDFNTGKVDSALGLMRRALLEADNLDPHAGLREAFVKRVHIAAILYMQGAAPDFPVARQPLIYGMCSEPEPSEWFRNQPQAQPAFVWYQLAELEAETSHRQEVLAELRKRTTATGGLLPLEIMLATRITAAAIRHLDVNRFLEALNTYPRAIVEGVRNLRLPGSRDPFNFPVGTLAPITGSEWRDTKIAEPTKHAVLSFMLACGAVGRADIIMDFRHKAMLVPGLAEEVVDLFRAMDEPSNDEKDISVIIASTVGRLLSGGRFDTNDVFLSAIYVIQLLDKSVLSQPVAEAMMSFYERIWPEILQERAFSIRSPTTNGPIILAALHKGKTAMQRMANMVLATEAAAKRGLSNDLRERISKVAAGKPIVNSAQE